MNRIVSTVKFLVPQPERSKLMYGDVQNFGELCNRKGFSTPQKSQAVLALITFC